MIKTPCIALLLLVIVAPALQGQPVVYPDTPLSYSTPVRWDNEESPEKRALGVLFFAQDPGGSRTQVLVETAEGTRLALVQRIDAPRGMMETLLREDQSGWWIRLDQELPARGSFQELRRQWQDAHDRAFAAGEGVEWSLKTGGGPLFEMEVPLLAQSADTAAFVRELEASGNMERLRSELPPAVVEALPFLVAAARAGSPVRPSFDEVVQILARTADVQEAPSWTVEETLPPPKGFPESAPEYAELLGRFEHPPLDGQD